MKFWHLSHVGRFTRLNCLHTQNMDERGSDPNLLLQLPWICQHRCLIDAFAIRTENLKSCVHLPICHNMFKKDLKD